ncbi:GNAT family N-acetyltransferase [Bauldia sp.]|uniref:GNAT family N-acetyltransferase n=1 Tax=Bauldia sp. TaxID=2575872 RepID=UPI003BAC2E70
MDDNALEAGSTAQNNPQDSWTSGQGETDGGVYVPAPDERDRVFQTITLAFLSDPLSRWIWPDADVYMAFMPRFVEAFCGSAIDLGTAYVAGHHRATALWLPPGAEPDTGTINALFESTISPEIGDDLAELFAKMAACHAAQEPVWYLPMIGADPAFTGKGYGDAILSRALQRCDDHGASAYLESSNIRNLSLYLRHGFKPLDQIQAGGSPTLYPMIRPPKSG